MKTPFDDIIKAAEAFVEGVGDEVEDAVYDLRDSFAVEAVRAGIVVALKATRKCPFIPSGIVIGCTGGVEIGIMGIRDRIEELAHYMDTPPKNRKEILQFFFTFAPTYIKVVPELEVSIFGVNATLGKGGFVIEGDDVLESLEQLITESP